MSEEEPEETMPFTHSPYGPLVTGSQEHKGASTAMFLGIASLVCLGISFFCCLTFPGVFCAPVAWVKGVRAQHDIDASPGVYTNRGQAVAGMVMGVIGSIVGAVALALIVVFVVLIGSGWSLV